MSGYTGATIANRGVLAEGSHFIAKPFGRGALLEQVRRVLDDD